jgi:ATP-binding cassette subfamily B protein AbcA/BmrA
LIGVLIKDFIDHAFIFPKSELIQNYDSKNLFSYLNRYIIYFSILALSLAFASGLRIFSINYLNDFLIFKIKEMVFKKMLDLEIKEFDQNGKNFFKTLLGFDVEELVSSVNLKLSLIARNIGLFFGSIILLFLNNGKLSLIIIVAILFVLFFISILGIRLRKLIKNFKEMKNQTFLYLDESICFIKLIKISNESLNQKKKLSFWHERILKDAFWLYIFRGIFIGFIIICLFLTIILTLYLGSLMILNGELTPGSLSSFIFYALISSTSLGGILESFFEISKYKLNFEKIQKILYSGQNNSKDENDFQELIQINNFDSIEFRDVSFGYIDGKENLILKNINFKIQKGQKVSTIGPSGSGKSTILNLILGFFATSSGKIFLNNVDLEKIQKESYYKKLSMLSQEVEIFSSSLYENLTYGIESPDEILLEQLIEKFNLKDLVESLPEKIHNKIGDQNGTKLSMGQKQRIGLIRAMMKKPEILILDESTASLDNQNESEIYDLLLSSNYKDLTIIFVTHKLSYLNLMNKTIKLSSLGEVEDCL